MSEKSGRDWKKWAIGGGLIAGIALIGGARFLMREKNTPEPDYADVDEDGDFAVRDYGSLWVAETISVGDRRSAIKTGFKALADYIFARSHDGDEVPMTVPVLQQLSGNETWTIGFVMPPDWARSELPDPPIGVKLEHEPARRVALVRFDGKPEEIDFAEQETRLSDWIEEQGLKPTGSAPLYAFYNSPAMPGPLRRNEIWVEIER